MLVRTPRDAPEMEEQRIGVRCRSVVQTRALDDVIDDGKEVVA